MIKIKTKKLLNSIKTLEEGTQVLLEEERKIYVYKDKKWEPLTGSSELNMSLYEINKTAIQALPDLLPNELEEKKALINELKTQGDYFMLLCHDIRYYTLFHIGAKTLDPDVNDFADDVIGVIKELGNIKSIEKAKANEDDDSILALEVWVVIDDEPHVLYLFNYDGGVIECQ